MRLRILLNGREQVRPLEWDDFTVGRDSSATVTVPHADISRKHARIRISGRDIFVTDLSSTNGTFINGARLESRVEKCLPQETFSISLSNVATVIVEPQPEPGPEAKNTPASREQEQAERQHSIQAAQVAQSCDEVGSRVAKSLVLRAREDAERLRADAAAEASRILEQARGLARSESQAIAAEIHATLAHTRTELTELQRMRDEARSGLREEQTQILEIKRERSELKEKDLQLRETVKDLKTTILETEREFLATLNGQERERDEVMHQLEDTRAELRKAELKLTDLLGEQRILASEIVRLRSQTEEAGTDLSRKLLERQGFDKAEAENAQLRESRDRITRARLEADEADLRTKKASVDALVAELEIKRLEAERTLLSVTSHIEQKRAELDQLKSGKEQFQRDEKQELLQLKAALVATQEEINRNNDTISRLRAEAQAASTIRDAAAATTRTIEQDLVRAKETTAAGLAQIVEDEAIARLITDTKLKAEHDSKVRSLEMELSRIRSNELAQIKAVIEEERKAEQNRRAASLTEITRAICDSADNIKNTKSTRDLENRIRLILSGAAPPSLSADLQERTRRLKKKILTRTAMGIAAVIAVAFLVEVFGGLRQEAARRIAATGEDNEVFLREIRQKSLKYQPDTDRQYRGTYWENILYLKDYAETKIDDKKQGEWTLEMNDRLPKELGISDKLIVGLIASEAVLVKELVTIRKSILPQFKEQGFERMKKAEEAGKARMLETLKTEENYNKFRLLERTFFEKNAPPIE